MKSIKWRVMLCGALCSAGISALLFGAVAASAAEVVAVPPPDAGTLYLETTNFIKMQFRWDRVAPDSDVIQKIVDKSLITHRWSDICGLALSPATTVTTGLVNLSAAAGFLGDHIGVKSSSGLCSEISGSESLTFALGGLLAGYQVYHTELNLEMKNRAVVRIDTTFGASTQTFIIRQPGTAYPASAPPVGPTVTDVVCPFETVTSERDICRWKSDAFWNSATIRTLAGKLSIEGGSGGGGGAFSRFSLTQLDEVLACAPSEGPPVPGITAEGPGIAVAIGTRLQNTDPEETCRPIPVALTWSDDPNPVLQFFKADLGQSVATTFAVTWPDAPVPEGGLGAIPLSQQQFVPGVDEDIDLCVGTPNYDSVPGEFEGQFVLVLTSLTPPEGGFPDLVEGGTTQYGCVYERSITLPNPGEGPSIFGLEEQIYLQGDWTAKRG